LLWSWNIAATCRVGGAKKWKSEHSEFLRGADVFLLPDNDNAGWEHVHKVGASLSATARTVRVLNLPGLPLKGDIIDWAKAGGTREQLDALLVEAPVWRLPKVEDVLDKKSAATAGEEELLNALAKMPKGIARGRERKRLKAQLGVSFSDIDAEIEARQVEAETMALLHGHWHVEPWPEPVDGDALIRDIIRKLQKHVALSFENALVIALWIMLAWVHDEVAIHSPILTISSAEPDSGKSTTLAIISFLVPRAISTVDISRGALYRAIDRWQPSFVIDEFDTVLADKGNNDKAELRSVINSGHTRGQGVLRCVTDDHTPEVFPTFAPKALGMVGRKMPATTLSRCVVAELRRAKTDEQDKKFEHKDDSELADLRSRLRRWSMDSVDALRDAKPSMPNGFENRRADNWRLQFKIADLCSGVEDWGDKARAAAVKIESNSDSRTTTAQLLAAIKAVFDNIGDDAIGSQELCDALVADPSSEWAEWGKSRKPITQHQLARMLKTHSIHPDQVRPKALGGKQARGYHRSWFEDAWSRYL
jgi:putative DNA primase/helicase